MRTAGCTGCNGCATVCCIEYSNGHMYENPQAHVDMAGYKAFSAAVIIV